MREPLAVPCEVEAASFSGRVPPATREAVAYVDLCGLALLDPRTLRASHRWRFTNLAGWHATSETTLSVRYIPRPDAGPRTITLLFPPGCAPEVQLDMERKVRMYAEGMIPRERLDDDPLPEGATLSADSLRDARTLPDAPLSDAVSRAAPNPRRGRVESTAVRAEHPNPRMGPAAHRPRRRSHRRFDHPRQTAKPPNRTEPRRHVRDHPRGVSESDILRGETREHRGESRVDRQASQGKGDGWFPHPSADDADRR